MSNIYDLQSYLKINHVSVAERADLIVIAPATANTIAKLANGQKLKLQAYAKLGRGSDHAKWQAVTTSVLLETDKEDEFILNLDSSGDLNPETVIKTAINIIDERIQEISNLISAN